MSILQARAAVLELLWTGFTLSSLDEIRLKSTESDTTVASTHISKQIFNSTELFIQFIRLVIFRGPQLGRCFKGLHCPILAVSGLGRAYMANCTYGCSACLHPRLVVWYSLIECLKLDSKFASAVMSLAIESLREEKRIETSAMVVCDDVATRRMNMKRSRWLLRALAVSGANLLSSQKTSDCLLRSLYDSSNVALKTTSCDAIRWLNLSIPSSVRKDLVRLANLHYDKERSHRDVLSKFVISLFQMLMNEEEEEESKMKSRQQRQEGPVYVAERFPTAMLLEWIPDLEIEDPIYVVEMQDEEKSSEFKEIYCGSVPFCSVSSLCPETLLELTSQRSWYHSHKSKSSSIISE